MFIEHLSVSRDSCFRLCEQQYKFKYHLKVVPNVHEQLYFTYGKLIHAAAENYVLRKGSTPIKDIIEELLQGKLEFDGYDNVCRLDETYYSKLYRHADFVEKFSQRIGFEGEIEHEIKYDLHPPHGKYFLGYIDRLIIKNDSALIIDYKTSKNNSWRKNKVTIKKDLQMCAYALYVHEKFNIKPEKIEAALVYLEEPKQIINTNFTIETLRATKKYLKESYLEIEEKKPENIKPTVGSHCQRCDFFDQCPYGG